MASLSLLGLAFYALVLIGAFAVRSAAGFGAVLLAVPLLALVLPVSTAVAVATALSLVTSTHQIIRDWHLIAWRQFLVMTIYTMLGIGLGFYFIKALDEHAMRHVLGVFLIVYSLYAVWTSKAPALLPARWHGALAAAAGVAGGFCGALFGGGVGPIYMVYFNAIRTSRDVFRVTMSMIMLFSSTTRIAGYASFGFYGRSALILLALGLPLVAAGSWLGDRLVIRLDPRLFGWFVGALVLLSGIALLFR